MRFPRRIRHKNKGRVLATIYKRPDGSYRVYWRKRGTDGKPKSEEKGFRFYADAKRFADGKVAELHKIAKGLSAPLLAEEEASDARAALDVMRNFHLDGFEKLSLHAVAIRYCESSRKLPKNVLVLDAVDGYLGSVVSVKRTSVAEAILQFIDHRATKTVAKDGKRPQLSPEHHYNTKLWLKEISKTFPPPMCVSDLTKRHLGLYMAKFGDVSAKTRNERRAVLRMFLGWCVEQDYLAPTHRLLEATDMKHEPSTPDEIELFTPDELRAMLEKADEANAKQVKPDSELVPLLALCGLAGLREREAMRLTFEEVFRVPGQIEVKASKSKTRSRRLVEVVPALAQWLHPYRNDKGLMWGKSYSQFHARFKALRDKAGVPDRRNGLRHAYISAHYAVHSDEGLTAKLAGTSPDMIHRHYKGLLTKEQGEAWFAVGPAQADNVIQMKESK